MTVDLRDYQRRVVDDLRAAIGAGSRTPLISVPTGAGKTRIALAVAAAASAKGNRTGVVVERVVLADQWREAARALGLDAGVLQASRNTHGADLQIYSSQTLEARTKPVDEGGAQAPMPWPQEPVVFIDECHIARSRVTEWIRTGRRPNQVIVGLTATPHPAGLGDTFDRLVQGPSTDALTAAGWLIPFNVEVGRASMDMSGAAVNPATGEYTAEAVDEEAAVVIGDIAQEWFARAMRPDGTFRPTIAFTATVASGKKLTDALNALTAEFSDFEVARQISYLSSPMYRDDTLSMFADGRLPVIVNVNVIGRGADLPNAEILVDASPFRASEPAYIQMIGRVLRPRNGRAEPGERALILDHCGNCIRFEAQWLDFSARGVTKLRGDAEKGDPEVGRWKRYWRCRHCAAAVPEGDPCPACGPQDGDSMLERVLLWECRVCGGANDASAHRCGRDGCAGRRPPSGAAAEDEHVHAAKAWTCTCGAENGMDVYACPDCGEAKAQSFAEVDGELKPHVMGGAGEPVGVDTQLDLRLRSNEGYLWRHIFELSRRHYLTRQKRVTVVLDRKAQKFARARFNDWTGRWCADSGIPDAREPRVDPRVEKAWERSQEEAAARNPYRRAEHVRV